jgi:hypothetical protein
MAGPRGPSPPPGRPGQSNVPKVETLYCNVHRVSYVGYAVFNQAFADR